MGEQKRVVVAPYGVVPVALLQEPGLTLPQLRAYAALSSFQGHDKKCWPKIPAVAERMGASEPTVKRAISALVGLGWVLRSRQGFGKGNVYVCMMAVAEEEHSDQHCDLNEASHSDHNVISHSDQHCDPTRKDQEKKPEEKIVTAAPEAVAPSYPKSSSDPRIKELIDYYYEAFKARCGFPPTVNGGAWGKIFRRHLRIDTPETIKAVIDEFFAYDKRARFAIYDFDRSYDNVYGRLYTLQHERSKRYAS